MKQKTNRVALIACTAFLLLTLSSTAWAQGFEQMYVKALLDSAHRYERLKPAYVNLQTITKLQDERYQASMLERRTEREMYQVQVKGLQEEVRAGRKRERKKLRNGLTIGAMIGIAIGLITY